MLSRMKREPIYKDTGKDKTIFAYGGTTLFSKNEKGGSPKRNDKKCWIAAPK